jgi:hypothetical protein
LREIRSCSGNEYFCDGITNLSLLKVGGGCVMIAGASWVVVLNLAALL